MRVGGAELEVQLILSIARELQGWRGPLNHGSSSVNPALALQLPTSRQHLTPKALIIHALVPLLPLRLYFHSAARGTRSFELQFFGEYLSGQAGSRIFACR
jgi:hypothetical protein